MIKGERKLKTAFGYDVEFDSSSTIVISKEEDGEYCEVSLDPTDLSVIYAAYTQMVREEIEFKKAEEGK